MNAEIKNYMQTLNLEEVCRTCLMESDEMTSLFAEIESSDYEEDISFVYQIFTNLTSIQIYVDDRLPTFICRNCIANANNALKFKIQCERSESLLQTYYANMSDKDEMQKELNTVKIRDQVSYTEEDVNDSDEDICNNDADKNSINISRKICAKSQEINLNMKTCWNALLNKEISHKHMMMSGTGIENTVELKDEVENEKLIKNLNNNTLKKQTMNNNFTKSASNFDKNIDDNKINTISLEPIQEIVIKPEIQIEFSETDSLDEPKTSTEEPNHQSELTEAATVALSAENLRLRERITLKKMYTNQNKKYPVFQNRKSQSYYTFTINESGQKVYSCTFCEKQYKHSPSLTVHMRSHTMDRPYLCTLCGKGFKQFTGLNYHMRSHTGEQPYACNLCDKRYRQSASLTAHMRVHTGQRPFLCSVCGKGFRQAPDLSYHMRTHTKEKPYMCSVCGKCMSMQCHLVQHMRTHTGEKPFACKECGKGFASTTRLKRHEIIHTGLKPFVCEVCKKAFNRSSTLRVHSMIHTDERPHQCQVCGKGFIQAHCLKSHLKTHF